MDRIEKTIQQLDLSGEESGTPQIIRLKYAQAGEIAPSLQEMFTGGTKSRGRPPVIIANEAANTLIIRADRQDLSAIRSLVAELDTDEETPPNFRLITIAQGVNVRDLAEKVEMTINESASMGLGSGSRGRPLSLRATPDIRSHSIILAGSPSLFDGAEELIRAMEKLGPPGGRVTSVITLNRTPVEDIERLIEGLKGEGGGSSSSRKSSSRRSSPSRKTTKKRGGR